MYYSEYSESEEEEEAGKSTDSIHHMEISVRTVNRIS